MHKKSGIVTIVSGIITKNSKPNRRPAAKGRIANRQFHKNPPLSFKPSPAKLKFNLGTIRSKNRPTPIIFGTANRQKSRRQQFQHSPEIKKLPGRFEQNQGKRSAQLSGQRPNLPAASLPFHQLQHKNRHS